MSHTFQLRCPFRMLVIGPSGSGKTCFIQRLIDKSRDIYDRQPGDVYYFYKVWQDKYEKFPHVKYREGTPTMKWMDTELRGKKNTTVVMDDLGRAMSPDVAEMFSVGSHHYDCNLIFVAHNLFDRNVSFRQISLNTTYMVIFKNPRDSSTITNFAKQFDPQNSRRLVNIYREATTEPFSYLFIDLEQRTDEDMRLRSGIFYENGPMRIFQRL